MAADQPTSDGPGRVAVFDLGTNTTRVLIADVAGGALTEVDRRTTITRLGQGVDSTGVLAREAMERVLEALAEYRALIDDLGGADETVAVATSAIRDASNGEDFRSEIEERFGIGVRTITGGEEARLTFLGATKGRPGAEPTMVLDIGGGSTEIVVGIAGEPPEFDVSTKAGSVRQTERHLSGDPPEPESIVRLTDDVRAIIHAGAPDAVRERTVAGIGVAGTATSLAAISQALDPYDPARVHGFELLLGEAERILALLAALPLEERRGVVGLHPERAPTIVAGAVILVEAMRAFGLDSMETSEADILHGAALEAAAGRPPR